MAKRSAIAVLVTSAVLLAPTVGMAGASNETPTRGTARCNPLPPPPMPPASEFVSGVDNTYFPLLPGTVFLYRGQEEGDHVQDRVEVTQLTKTILGVSATVVRDEVQVNGLPSERTADWYAQDKDGNVWYLGEAAFDFVNGHWIRASDSWQAGFHGALPGIIMEAHSKVGDTYRQEYYAGHAEDMAQVQSTHATLTVPYGTFHHALQTMECTPLEPGVFDGKYYARGVGEVAEATVRGGSSRLELFSVTHQ
jgi:hypothetical protein